MLASSQRMLLISPHISPYLTPSCGRLHSACLPPPPTHTPLTTRALDLARVSAARLLSSRRGDARAAGPLPHQRVCVCVWRSLPDLTSRRLAPVLLQPRVGALVEKRHALKKKYRRKKEIQPFSFLGREATRPSATGRAAATRRRPTKAGRVEPRGPRRNLASPRLFCHRPVRARPVERCAGATKKKETKAPDARLFHLRRAGATCLRREQRRRLHSRRFQEHGRPLPRARLFPRVPAPGDARARDCHRGPREGPPARGDTGFQQVRIKGEEWPRRGICTHTPRARVCPVRRFPAPSASPQLGASLSRGVSSSCCF